MSSELMEPQKGLDATDDFGPSSPLQKAAPEKAPKRASEKVSGRFASFVELLKPITWFAPMWAYGCGVVSSGVPDMERLPLLFAGVLVAGPLVCGTSQALNDWYDRHVDAINQPERPIPSGRIPGRWGLYIGIIWALASLAVATLLGPWGFAAAVVALFFAWAYSAPPLRLKMNGWWGNLACGVCYEGLPWFTAAAVMAGTFPDWQIVSLALLYSIGAHGIMTLNDFKSIEGDMEMGVRTLPVQMGVARAARFACYVMALPQVAVVGLLAVWGFELHAGIVAVLLLVQIRLMGTFVQNPAEKAPWYNAVGTGLYVIGMLVSAFALFAAAG